jgi:hypothetical protein
VTIDGQGAKPVILEHPSLLAEQAQLADNDTVGSEAEPMSGPLVTPVQSLEACITAPLPVSRPAHDGAVLLASVYDFHSQEEAQRHRSKARAALRTGSLLPPHTTSPQEARDRLSLPQVVERLADTTAVLRGADDGQDHAGLHTTHLAASSLQNGPSLLRAAIPALPQTHPGVPLASSTDSGNPVHTTRPMSLGRSPKRARPTAAGMEPLPLPGYSGSQFCSLRRPCACALPPSRQFPSTTPARALALHPISCLALHIVALQPPREGPSVGTAG